MDLNDGLRGILIDVHRYLERLKSEGVDSIDMRKTTAAQESVTRTDVTASEPVSPHEDVSLRSIRDRIGDCHRCKLHLTRTHIVFGEGNPDPEIVFVGEGPGSEEDQTGLPFVGKAGQLLDRIILAMGLSRKDVYICNVVKCRPPNNRVPETDEMTVCGAFLEQQIMVLQPRIIVALGVTAAKWLLGKSAPMVALRGQFHDYKGICLRATYHPAALLRNPEYRKPVWEDVQEVMKYLGRPIAVTR